MNDYVDDPQVAVLSELYPEISAGGFSRFDGTVQFYARVNALLDASMRVVDYGAGRGEWVGDPVPYRRNLRTLRGKVASVVGVDIDDIVLSNPTVDERIVCPDRRTIPLGSESVDVIVSDNVFEHIDEPEFVCAEMARVLKPGGWVCARTPNKYGYIAAAASVVPNARHVAALRRLQPGRDSVDVFPTRYRLNTLRALERYFPEPAFANYSYFWAGEPGYFGRSSVSARAMNLLSRGVPGRLKPKLFVFLQKQGSVRNSVRTILR